MIKFIVNKKQTFLFHLITEALEFRNKLNVGDTFIIRDADDKLLATGKIEDLKEDWYENN
jgi:archaeosine-15-forming tRNA-guanine transglycosylase